MIFCISISLKMSRLVQNIILSLDTIKMLAVGDQKRRSLDKSVKFKGLKDQVQGLELNEETVFLIGCNGYFSYFTSSSPKPFAYKKEMILQQKNTQKRKHKQRQKKESYTCKSKRATLIDIHRAYIGILIVFIYSLYYELYIVSFLCIGLG